MKSRDHVVHAAVALVLCVLALPVSADDAALRMLNSLRTSECVGRPADIKPVKTNGKLNDAAQFVKAGLKTHDALKRAGYLADQSSMIHIGGPMDNASLKRVLAKSYCKTLADAGLVEVGIARGPEEIVVVFAAPFAPPSPADAGKVAQQVLKFVNDARARPRKCGRKAFGAVPPLTLNATLSIAAVTHAKDMSSQGRMSHVGSDGSSPADRATRAGYVWKSVGENVASGQLTAREVVDGWLSSPHHCENIMDADFMHMAVAYAINTKQEIGIYWAQVFGKPR